MRARALLTTAVATSLLCAATASAQTPVTPTGGAAYTAPAAAALPAPVATPTPAAAPGQPVVPGAVAVLLPDGTAAAPDQAPPQVKAAIRAANEILGKPYVYGGGHGAAFRSRGYDCSGAVSYALHGGGLLDAPLDSSSFMAWEEKGAGAWVTTYSNPGHAFVVIAGLRLDTSAAGDPSGAKGPRWRPVLRRTTGFRARHPLGL